jgi:hypothetical protein
MSSSSVTTTRIAAAAVIAITASVFLLRAWRNLPDDRSKDDADWKGGGNDLAGGKGDVLVRGDDDDNDNEEEDDDDDHVVDGSRRGEEVVNEGGWGRRICRLSGEGEINFGGAVDGYEGGEAGDSSVPSLGFARDPPLPPSTAPPPSSSTLSSSSSSSAVFEESHNFPYISMPPSHDGVYGDWPSIRENVSVDDNDDNAERRPACIREGYDKDDGDDGESDPRLILRALSSSSSDGDSRYRDDGGGGDGGGDDGGGEGGEAEHLRGHYVKIFKTSTGGVMTESEFLAMPISTSDNDGGSDIGGGVVAASCDPTNIELQN